MRTVSYQTRKHSKSKIGQAQIFINQEWFSKTLLSMGEAVIATDHKGAVTSMNKLAEELTGWSLAESRGKPIDSIFDAINEHTHLPIENPINIALNENRAILLANHTILIKKDKTQRNIVDSAVPLHNDNSEIIGGALIFRDVTELSISRKKLLESERLLKETLELVARLQQKNRDLRQFSDTLSHDLRAPVNRVLSLVSLFSREPELKINNKTIMENVASEITNLDNVITGLTTTISDRDEGKQEEYMAFETELALLKKVLENEINESKAVITADFHKAAGIDTVKSYLYSIMYNLLSNAIKYRSPRVPLTIHLQTQLDNEFICLTVKDNGMGIDLNKNRDKLFGLYNRFHSKKIEGKGIGLNLVKAQAESLGGKVEVESEVNHGSTFKIFIPVNHNQDETG
ncbi:MAG TPA: ATP-binding protein [Bacteroidia bacterium]|nr:ATP-binding protein [Bacteroidia bacterium]